MKKAIVISVFAAACATAAALAGCNVSSHTHEFTEWGNDDTYHWRECAKDGVVDEGSKAPHVIRTDNTCECGYVFAYTESLEFAEVYAKDGLSVMGYAVNGISESVSVTNLVIPNYYNGKPVVEISDEAFKNNGDIQSVILPNTIEKIGMSAFWGVDFEKLNLPENLTEIGNYAFAGCVSIESVTIGSNIKTVGTQVFNGCTSLKSVEINCTNAEFGSYLFAGCTALKTCTVNGETALGNNCFYACTDASVDVIYGDGVENIPQLALQGKTFVKSVTIPKSVKIIGAGAFDGLEKLEKVNYGGTIDEWAQIDFKSNNSNPFYVRYGTDTAAAFYIGGNEVKGTVTISAETINSYAFYGYSKNFVRVILADTVKTVGQQAFACNVTNNTLKSIVILGKAISFSPQAFYNCSGMDIYYKGTYGELQSNVNVGAENVHSFDGCKHYFYSEDGTYNPGQEVLNWEKWGGIWHYDDQGNITVWDI